MRSLAVIPHVNDAKLRKILERIPTPTLVRFEKIGITGNDLVPVMELAAFHQRPMASMASWIERGHNLATINTALSMTEEFPDFTDSVEMASRFIEAIDAHYVSLPGGVPPLVEDIFSTFQECFSSLSGHLQAYQLWYRIEEVFGGDVIKAYHMANHDPDAFLQLILGKTDLVGIAASES